MPTAIWGDGWCLIVGWKVLYIFFPLAWFIWFWTTIWISLKTIIVFSPSNNKLILNQRSIIITGQSLYWNTSKYNINKSFNKNTSLLNLFLLDTNTAPRGLSMVVAAVARWQLGPPTVPLGAAVSSLFLQHSVQLAFAWQSHYQCDCKTHTDLDIEIIA